MNMGVFGRLYACCVCLGLCPRSGCGVFTFSHEVFLSPLKILVPLWLSFNADTQTFSGTPTNSNVGEIIIKVSASDSNESVSNSFTLTIVDVNNAPSVNSDTASTDEDIAVNIDVLSNDDDPDGDTLTVTAATAANGTVVINSDNTLSYTPNSRQI